MSHTGYNQEDSLLFNKGSIERGLFQATIYHTEKDEDKQKINGDEEIRCKPDPSKTKGMKFANYDIGKAPKWNRGGKGGKGYGGAIYAHSPTCPAE